MTFAGDINLRRWFAERVRKDLHDIANVCGIDGLVQGNADGAGVEIPKVDAGLECPASYGVDVDRKLQQQRVEIARVALLDADRGKLPLEDSRQLMNPAGDG